MPTEHQGRRFDWRPRFDDQSRAFPVRAPEEEVAYRWAFSLDDVLHAVSQVGPVVIGCNWYEGMMEPDSTGIVHPTGDVVGGHCVLVRGVAVKREWVRFRNSWGDWGPLHGDGRLR